MFQQKLSDIDEFLTHKQIAMIGVSRKDKDFSRLLLKAFLDNGFDMKLVNTQATLIDHTRCYSSIADVKPMVEAAIIMLKPDKMMEVAKECIHAGVKNVWLYGVTGPKQVGEEVIDYLHKNNIKVIAGYCPFMFLDNVSAGHKFHKFIWKMIGFYPKSSIE